MTGGEGQRAWTEEALKMLNERLNAFMRMFVDTFVEHYNSGLYTFKYHLFEQMLKDVRKFGIQSVLKSSPHEHFKVHIKHSYSARFQMRQTRMMEASNVLQSGYKLLSNRNKRKLVESWNK